MDRHEQIRRRLIGGALAAVTIIAWLSGHIVGVFFWRWTPVTTPFAPVLILLETWLSAGMFIVAHDAMHGSLLPGCKRWNSVVGQTAVGLYAGFDYRRLATNHHQHHATPGAAADPDFHAERPTEFWRWYGRFFRTYFGWPELLRLAVVFWAYLLVFKASPVNMGVFWGLPSILSSLQLFAFGTWLPHRHVGSTFPDDHRARTVDRGWWYTLITCFHFGLHHEHHLHPQEPWWRLPRVRRSIAP